MVAVSLLHPVPDVAVPQWRIGMTADAIMDKVTARWNRRANIAGASVGLRQNEKKRQRTMSQRSPSGK